MKFRTSALIAMALLVVGCSPILDEDQVLTNFRPYISTNMAKAVMKDNTPDEVDPVDEKCDGSGWITHGDGHKTPCPGCPNCKDTQKQKADTSAKSKYVIYHFGAEWCSPCKQMKSRTWSNSIVKKTIKEEDAKLYYLDYDNKEHKQFFDYYKVSSMPTVIMVARGEESKVIYKDTGYRGPESMAKIIANQLK